MPRIYEATGARPEDLTDLTLPMDYCRKCYPAAKRAAALINKQMNDPYYHEVDQDHPPYEETEYCCETCGKTLTERDN